MTISANVNLSDGTVGISLVAITGDPQAPCHGTARFKRWTRPLPDIITSNTGGAQWSWRVPAAVPSGHWRLSVICEVQQHNRVRRLNMLVDRGSGPGQLSRLFAPGSLQSRKFNASADDAAGGSGAGADGSLYPIGQCTWWVARKRPDLPLFPGHSGDAKNWASSARAAGWPTGSAPEAGAVAVFQPNQYAAGESGHVAYVERVDGKRILVSEAHFGSHPGSERWLRWDGLEFIYHRPAPTQQTTMSTQPDTVGTVVTSPTTTTPPPAKVLHVTHYQCDYASPTLNHTINAGQHWGTQFITQGTSITNGMLYVAAQDDKPDHTAHHATLGLYKDTEMTQVLATMDVVIPVGGTGIEFTFPQPVSVDYDDQLYIALTAIDPFTAYDVDQSATSPDDPEGCFIGRVEGASPATYYERVTPNSAARTFRDPNTVSDEGAQIAAGRTVKVFCRVYSPSIPSVEPDGFWYLIATGPWKGHYYSPANTFLNGDPPNGPYQHNTDFDVPEC